MFRVTAGIAATAFAFFLTLPAQAADLRPAYKAQPVTPAVHNWSGFYVGGHLGYGWGKADTSFNPGPSPAVFVNLAPTVLDPDPNGAIAGGQIGFNWQAGQWVYGIEADISWTDISGNARLAPIPPFTGAPANPGAAYLAAEQDIKYLGTVRGRLGYAWDRLLLYVTGGLAYGKVNYTGDTNFGPPPFIRYFQSFSETQLGWTIGGGGEWAFNPNWSFKAEYLYFDLGDVTRVAVQSPVVPPFSVTNTFETKGHIVRGGLNYKF